MVGKTSVPILYVLMVAGIARGDILPSTVNLEITSRSEAFRGVAFGDNGTYEHLVGIAHMEIDPKSQANRGIVDLDRAPRDTHGFVHYDVDVEILRPRDPTRARRVMVYDVVNRGMKLITAIAGGGSLAATDAAAIGNALLLREGFTIVWSGWQGDISGPHLIGARFPVATNGTHPITERIATETIFEDLISSHIALPYPTATLDGSNTSLAVREREDDVEQTIAPSAWRFEDKYHIALSRPVGLDAGAIYRVTYVARDPKVMGLGFAAVRDLVAFLRYGKDLAGNPLADISSGRCERNATAACIHADGAYDSTIAFGMSQSGRYLRDFLWQGFNRDLVGKRVFDGVIVGIAGARRTFTNTRFSEPGRFSRQHEDHDVPGFDFPFAYGSVRDSVTGRTDGILARCTKDGTCPRIFHIDSSTEFWQGGASLVGTGGTDHDVALPKSVRAYLIASGSHAPGVVMPSCLYAANALSYTPVIRALLIAMINWVSERQEPPESIWPRLAEDELRSITALNVPNLSAVGISWPTVINRPVSPAGARVWPVLVPRVDADGNDTPGIRMPELAAPAGTYLGWNARKAGYAQGDLCNALGSFIPFARDASDRNGDPRASIAERFAQETRYAFQRSAFTVLQRKRLLLEEDLGILESQGSN